MEKRILVQISSEQRIECAEEIVKIVYGAEDKGEYDYGINKEEKLINQIEKIKKIMELHKIEEVLIHDINNSMALVEVCKALSLPYTISVEYPINWVSKFAKYYFKYHGIGERVIIKYKENDYIEQYKNFFNSEEYIDTKENLNDIKLMIEDYESQLCGKNNKLIEIQEWANYLSNELVQCKASRAYKIGLKVSSILNSKIFKLVKKSLHAFRYASKYGTKRTIKKMFYKVVHYSDIPLWEEDNEMHYNDLYEFKFFRYKNSRDKINKLQLKRINHRYKKNLASIVLPVYNGEDTLREALESIINQTYKKFECIMVNDGSTDKSLDIMKEYASKDKRFIIVDQKNGKLPKALNNGFKCAKGEFYTWTSCDNNMHPQYIERMVKQLKQDKNVDFIYADLKLIDENSDILKGFGWYEIPENSGNVILPTNIKHLNVYPNNYIGAAFMYRSAVHKILSDYSEKRYTVEDYDYWQRINSLFNVKKARLSEPLYYYRFHSKSLTAQAKELKINNKRDEMMLYDDFRRDYYLIPFCWVIKHDKKSIKTYNKVKEFLNNNNQIIIDEEIYNSKSFSRNYSNVIYLNLVKNSIQKQEENIFDVRIEKGTIFGKNKLIFNHINGNEYIFKASLKNILKTIEIAAKDYYTIQYENYLYKEKEYDKKLSIVICTYKRNKQLEEAITSAIEQTEDKCNYEILVINNDIETKEIEKIVESFRNKYNVDDQFLRYCVAPIKGLSYARNVGMYEARGKNILYIDDDSICDSEIVKEVIKAFKANPNAGVVGGKITLRVPNKAKDIYLPEYAGLWSQYEIKGQEYVKINSWCEFPYGANIAMSRNALLEIGGFRTAYGRRENDFSGGEEIVLSYLISKLKKDIIAAPKSKVIHAVADDRFSNEHIKKTYYNGILTWYRLYLDMYIDEIVGIDDINYKINLVEEKGSQIKDQTQIKNYYLEAEKEAVYKLKDYYYEIEKMRFN